MFFMVYPGEKCPSHFKQVWTAELGEPESLEPFEGL